MPPPKKYRLNLSKGVRTRGDNNLNFDLGVLSADEIIGCVVSVERAHKEISVCGGKWGRTKAEFLLTAFLHPIYHRIARAGIFRHILPPWVRPKILCFKRPAGTEMQLLMGGWVVGRRLAEGRKREVAIYIARDMSGRTGKDLEVFSVM